MNNKKIGVGILTYNRPEFLNSLVQSMKPCMNNINELVILNDGDPTTSDVEVIQNEVNLGVAKSKNKIMQTMLDRGMDYIFIIEDDMLILKPEVFTAYAHASEVSGIQHMNYGPGSPFNRVQVIQNYDLHNRHLLDQHTEPKPRMVVDYGTCKIALYEHTVAMFSFFTREVIEKVGFMCEDYDKCWEHVCHTYSISKAGYTTPFWMFADIFESHKYLTEAPGAIENSAIAKDKSEWMEKVMAGREIYKKRHGHYPNEALNPTEAEVVAFLKKIKP